MFYLLPRLVIILFVCFGAALAWRAWRQRHARWRVGSAGLGDARWPLVPAAVMRGADRTWVVFTTPDCLPCRTLVERLRAAEPTSQVTEIDAEREPRLAEAFRVDTLPAVLRVNRYGQVEERLVGLAAVGHLLR